MALVARYDLAYEVRDRARFLAGLVSAGGIGRRRKDDDGGAGAKVVLSAEDFARGVSLEDVGAGQDDGEEEKQTMTGEQVRAVLFEGKAFDAAAGLCPCSSHFSQLQRLIVTLSRRSAPLERPARHPFSLPRPLRQPSRGPPMPLREQLARACPALPYRRSSIVRARPAQRRSGRGRERTDVSLTDAAARVRERVVPLVRDGAGAGSEGRAHAWQRGVDALDVDAECGGCRRAEEGEPQRVL